MNIYSIKDHNRELILHISGDDITVKYGYDAADNILGITNVIDPAKAGGKSQLGGAFSHTYVYDELNRLITASGKAKSASYEMAMTFGRMSEPLTKVQKVDSTRTAQSYDFTYRYEDDSYPTAPTQVGHDHYTYDANGNPILVENDSLNTERRMYWDEDNRLMVLSDNGKTSRYTYNAAGERIVKSHGDLEGVYINGAPQGISFHETEDYTIYPAPIITVTKNRFTKHYFIGSKRIASKIGTGRFSNVYGIGGNNITAGQKDYAARMMQIEKQREEYYKQLGTPPGVPTMKGATADPDNTGIGYNSIITDLGDHSVPEGWIQHPKFNGKGDVPGPPIQWSEPESPDNAQPGYGYIPTDTTNTEDIFFYHSDHLGSTSYITDAKANITQFDAYLPYGELLVDEHTSSEDMPYKFNGKELDQETGLYYYGARYMNPVTSLWYGVDPEKEKSFLIGSYTFCNGNPIRLVDPDGKWSWPWERASLIEYRGEGVFGIRLENFSTATRNSFARANNDPKNWKHGEIGINTEVGKISINNYAHKNYSVGRKLPGIDPKDGAINIKRPIARSTGQEDRRFHKFEPMPIRGSAKAVGAIAILNISISAIDTYLTYTTFWDSEALNKQKALLFTSINAVNLHMDLIPEEFRNDDKMGAIVNYVFQGENPTGDKEITRIGKQILQKMERYDKESKRYKPVIED